MKRREASSHSSEGVDGVSGAGKTVLHYIVFRIGSTLSELLKFGSDLYYLISMDLVIKETLPPATFLSHQEPSVNFMSPISKHLLLP